MRSVLYTPPTVKVKLGSKIRFYFPLLHRRSIRVHYTSLKASQPITKQRRFDSLHGSLACSLPPSVLGSPLPPRPALLLPSLPPAATHMFRTGRYRLLWSVLSTRAWRLPLSLWRPWWTIGDFTEKPSSNCKHMNRGTLISSDSPRARCLQFFLLLNWGHVFQNIAEDWWIIDQNGVDKAMSFNHIWYAWCS